LIWADHRNKLIFTFTLLAALALLLYLAARPQSPLPAVNYLAADKRCGVTVDLTVYDSAGRNTTLAALQANGLVWLRQPALWSEIEPEPGVFNWQPLDRVFNAVAAHNSNGGQFRVVLVLHTSPAWARGGSSPTAPPTNTRDFGNFARTLAGRYGSQTDHYQIWHEPNLSENWGDSYVEPAAYAALLREAALNIRTVDPQAVIINAALAPTLENGPLNLNELDYLRQLYAVRANDWFDVVAGQAYGFDLPPTDPPQVGALNFERLALLRQVMLDHGDADTPIWATAYGWDVLPPVWTGQPPPWRTDQETPADPGIQAAHHQAGLEYARQQWPWLGPVMAIRWDSNGLAADDPARGFALAETPLAANFCVDAAEPSPIATVGNYPATHPSGQYSPGWREALTLTDIPSQEPRTLTIDFTGPRLDLAVTRGDYRGYLWVTVDGQPANALPRDSAGHTYVVLYDPQRQSDNVTLARNLPPGPHQAVITAEGGWGQWAIGGWRVSGGDSLPISRPLMLLAAAVAIASGGGLLWQFRKELAALKLTCPLMPVRSDMLQMGVLVLLALAFYLVPGVGGVLLLPLLAAAILYRPDLGLVLLAFSMSFFQASKTVPGGLTYHLTETTLLLAAVGFGLRRLVTIATRQPCTFASDRPNVAAPGEQIFTRTGSQEPPTPPKHPGTTAFRKFFAPSSFKMTASLNGLDWATLALLGLGLAATLTSTNFGVSMHGWRMLLLGPVLYYFLVRAGADYGPPPAEPAHGPPRWAWRLADGLLAGAVLHTLIALAAYFMTGAGVESDGVRRLLSPFYGSPNNLALFLGRVWPLALAVAVNLPALPRLPTQAGEGKETPSGKESTASGRELRRWLYGLGLLPLSLALWLTYSRGALLVGLPAAVVVMAAVFLLQQRPKGWPLLMGIGGLLLLTGLSLLSRVARFRSLFDMSAGSSTQTRLQLWRSSLQMAREHWLLGVGVDNFLHEYRRRYVLPAAWQEPELSHSHNIVLDFATRLGLGGVAVIVWLQVAFWLTAWRLYQKLPIPLVLGLTGSMAVFLSHGLIDNSYFLVDLAYIFFLTAGIIRKLGTKCTCAEIKVSSPISPPL
jgi:hypothetical protein